MFWNAAEDPDHRFEYVAATDDLQSAGGTVNP
jgi:hypothetical protein